MDSPEITELDQGQCRGIGVGEDSTPIDVLRRPNHGEGFWDSGTSTTIARAPSGLEDLIRHTQTVHSQDWISFPFPGGEFSLYDHGSSQANRLLKKREPARCWRTFSLPRSPIRTKFLVRTCTQIETLSLSLM
jgi:hypothetical protein